MNAPNDIFIDEAIEAVHQDVDEAELSAASRRFRATLPAPTLQRTRFRGALRWAGAVATLALLISVVPLLLPERLAGPSLALAQQWFERYRTLQVEMVTRQNGTELSRVAVWSEAGGATRVEVPPMVQVIDPVNDVMHFLLPGDQVMSRPIGVDVDALALSDELAWLEELRDFQGLADLMPATRPLDGVDARGWALELGGGRHVLWVDPADHRPLLLEAELPGGLTMETRFTFDEPLPEGVFEPAPLVR